MTGTEAALAARRYANAYKYIYGAKGEFCSSAHIEELIAQSPTYFSDAQKKTAARAKAGSYCADCSSFVCICSGSSQYGSYALFDIAEKKYPLTKENEKILANGTFIPLGAIVWKPGHVGIYVGNQTVVEARSELVDVETNLIGFRDFTYCLLLPGIEYTANPNDATVVNVNLPNENDYKTWLGKIVNTPIAVPQIAPSNKQAAVGFGMLNNGTQVTVVGVDGDYYRIKSTLGSYGYVYSYYIGTVNAASYENQYNQWTGSANSTTGIVNIRTGPSTVYEQHGNVPSVANGATFDVLGEVLV